MKSKAVKYILGLLGLAIVWGCSPKPGSTESISSDQGASRSANKLVEQYFPKMELPLVVEPYSEIPKEQVLKGKDKELLFPEAVDGDIHAIARIDLFPNFTTIVYREDWLYTDVYIVSYPEGHFTTLNSQAIAGTFVWEDQGDGYNIASIDAKGLIVRKFTLDSGETYDQISECQYTSDNKLVYF